MRVAISVGILALAVIGSIQGYSHWRKEYRQPCSVGNGQSIKPDRAFSYISCRTWKTGSEELFYAISVGYVDFEPIMPILSFTYSYDIHKGGELIVNGSTIQHTSAKRLLALNPFGEMQEITLTAQEAQTVASGNEEKIWESVVLKRLYRFSGNTENGKRVGRWECSDVKGRRAYQGEYLDGRRHGKWTYYYPSGTIRAEIEYTNGKRNGKWVYFSDDGKQTDFLTWNNDVPVERPVRQAGLGHAGVITPNGNSQHSWY